MDTFKHQAWMSRAHPIYARKPLYRKSYTIYGGVSNWRNTETQEYYFWYTLTRGTTTISTKVSTTMW